MTMMHRGGALLVGLVVLTASIVIGPQAAAGDGAINVEEAAALALSVTSAAVPDRAFARLTTSEQAAVRAYLTPVVFVSAPARAGPLKGARPLANSCNTAHNWIRGQNSFGVTMWQFDHEVTWCWDGSIITNNPATRSWPSNVCCGWEYMGLINEARYPSDGYGQTIFTYQSQGHYRLNCCTNPSNYPTLRTEVYYNGGYFMEQWP